jgi:hypothetical protein
MRHWSDTLVAMGACAEAVAWCRKQPSAAVAWRKCQRADWMIWWISRRTGCNSGRTHRKLVRVACEIARGVLAHVPAGEERPRLAIEAAERWAENPTAKNRAAASAASCAASAARAATWAATWAAASAASCAASAARAAASAAASAASCATWAASCAASTANAAVVRKHFPRVPKITPKGKGGTR